MALNIADSRMLIKRSTITGQTPSIPPSADFTDGTWSATDTMIGELFLNIPDHKVWLGVVGPSFIELVDTSMIPDAQFTYVGSYPFVFLQMVAPAGASHATALLPAPVTGPAVATSLGASSNRWGALYLEGGAGQATIDFSQLLVIGESTNGTGAGMISGVGATTGNGDQFSSGTTAFDGITIRNTPPATLEYAGLSAYGSTVSLGVANGTAATLASYFSQGLDIGWLGNTDLLSNINGTGLVGAILNSFNSKIEQYSINSIIAGGESNQIRSSTGHVVINSAIIAGSGSYIKGSITDAVIIGGSTNIIDCTTTINNSSSNTIIGSVSTSIVATAPDFCAWSSIIASNGVAGGLTISNSSASAIIASNGGSGGPIPGISNGINCALIGTWGCQIEGGTSSISTTVIVAGSQVHTYNNGIHYGGASMLGPTSDGGISVNNGIVPTGYDYTTDATPVSFDILNIKNRALGVGTGTANNVQKLLIKVIAVNLSTYDVATWDVTGVIKNLAGTITTNLTTIAGYTDTAMLTCALTFTSVTDFLQATITGITASNIKWSFDIQYMKINGE